MKKLLAILLLCAMTAGFAACGAAPIKPAEEPAPVPSSSQNEEPAETAAPAEPDPTPSPAETGLIGILNEINENYHPGTAGSGMIACKYAAMLLDWFEEYPNTDTVTGSAANFAAVTNTEDGEFADKMLTMWRDAITLTFGNTGELESVGYTPVYDTWSAEQTYTLFTKLYEGLGLELPELIHVYYGGFNAEHMISTYFPAESADDYEILYALKSVGAVSMDVGLHETSFDGYTMTIDFSPEFGTQLRTYGSAGEVILMGSVVRTYLEAYGAEMVYITVDGAAAESGHNVYDYALTAADYDF